MVEEYWYDKNFNEFFLWGKRRQRHEKTKEWSNFILFFQNCLVGHILKKSTHPLLGAWSFLVHIRFTPSEGPKDFVNWFFKKSDHGR